MIESFIAERGPDVVLVLAVTASTMAVAIWGTLASSVRGTSRGASVGTSWPAVAAALWIAWVLVR